METYSPKEVTVIVGDEIMGGFAEGSMVKAEHNNDLQSLFMGGDGSGARVINSDESGVFEISLKSTSASNQYLSSLADSKGVVPVFVKDDSGADLSTAKEAFIAKKPAMDKGNAMTTNVWRLVTPNLFINHGGNAD